MRILVITIGFGIDQREIGERMCGVPSVYEQSLPLCEKANFRNKFGFFILAPRKMKEEGIRILVITIGFGIDQREIGEGMCGMPSVYEQSLPLCR